MDKILLLLTITLTGFLSAQTDEWAFIGKNDEGSSFYFGPNANNTAWIKEESKTIFFYSGWEKKSVEGQLMTLFKYNCQERQLAYIKRIVYDKNGKVLDNFQRESDKIKMESPMQNSLGENYLNAFCSQ